MTKLIKIGEVNFEKYKTEFFITQKTKRYLKEKNISLASLLPNGWLWYELTLFDLIKEKHGKKFNVIYNGIVEKRNLTKEGNYTEEISQEGSLKINKEIITKGTQLINKPKGEDCYIKYILLKKA